MAKTSFVTKTQAQVMRHMLVGRAHLKWDGQVWHYSHVLPDCPTTVRGSTVAALMRGGLLTQGFDITSLTEAGVKAAQNVPV